MPTETRQASVTLTIRVDKYYPHCCGMSCSALSDIATGAMPLDEATCRMFNMPVVYRSVSAGDICDTRPNRCYQCLERFPEPTYVELNTPPDFVIGETYRCRHPNSTYINVYVYNGIDAWGHHVFETAQGNTAMGDTSHMIWYA